MEKILPVNEWSVSMRINHWTMALSIFILIVTGFYIADPFVVGSGETVNKFLMGNIRFVHIFFGIVLLFVFIWRIYLAFFSTFHADWKDFLAFTDVKNTVDQIKFYLLIKKDPPEHKCLYGPMQSLAYLGLLGMVLLIVITGLILMGAGYYEGFTAISYRFLRPVANTVGGLAMIRYIHHLLTWCFILFIVVHVYMAFWYDAVLKKGTISSMVSGKLFETAKE
ncbi:MAG: Ni/Fe-hydrogenase, b-type cytochrome subunit [Syntrophales bacterium]